MVEEEQVFEESDLEMENIVEDEVDERRKIMEKEAQVGEDGRTRHRL